MADLDTTMTDRVRTSRALGADASFVLHGGGNTSAKATTTDIRGHEVDVLLIKGSGWDLATIEPPGFPACDLGALRALREVDSMDDETMVREVRRTMLDPSGPTPSVETLLHAFLPHRFVDHSHADAIIALSNRQDGEALCRKVYGDRVVSLPWIMPGFPLAKAVADAVDANPDVDGVLLHGHGLFTFADTADESLRLHEELVGLAADRYAQARTEALGTAAESRACWRTDLPRLRGALGNDPSFMLDVRDDPWILAALERADARELLVGPPLTPDHTIRCKCLPCWIESIDESGDAVQKYAAAYHDYVDQGIDTHGPRKRLDPMPRVLLVPGVGLIGVGETAKAASIAADITEHTVLTKIAGAGLGPYRGLNDLDLFEMEYWSLEQAKLAGKTRRELNGKVAVITGGAGAIGEGTARVLHDAGAAIAVLDTDLDAAQGVVDRLGSASMAVLCDVTDAESTAVAMDAVCRKFGGLDILVPNAGIAHSAPISGHDLDAWRRVVEVNQVGAFITIQAGMDILLQQGLGGSIVLISSKNVLGPGAEFSAYSASKAGMHQLGRVAALEGAEHDIRVNMVCPDAVFGCGDNSSGLWDEVGPDRAASRGLEAADLPEFYRNRNLLKSPVTAEDVGRAVLFFAARRTPTTGGVLNVDGGVANAFPR